MNYEGKEIEFLLKMTAQVSLLQPNHDLAILLNPEPLHLYLTGYFAVWDQLGFRFHISKTHLLPTQPLSPCERIIILSLNAYSIYSSLYASNSGNVPPCTMCRLFCLSYFSFDGSSHRQELRLFMGQKVSTKGDLFKNEFWVWVRKHLCAIHVT